MRIDSILANMAARKKGELREAILAAGLNPADVFRQDAADDQDEANPRPSRPSQPGAQATLDLENRRPQREHAGKDSSEA